MGVPETIIPRKKSTKTAIPCQKSPGQDKALLLFASSVSTQHIFSFPATSDGTKDSLNNTSGGHCDDVANDISMKMMIYVCSNKTGMSVIGKQDASRFYASSITSRIAEIACKKATI